MRRGIHLLNSRLQYGHISSVSGSTIQPSPAFSSRSAANYLRPASALSSTPVNTSKFSICGRWPRSGSSYSTAPGMSAEAVGMSPIQYVQKLRVERATQLLETGHASLESVAAQVGYADPSMLRKLLRRERGVTPRGVRQRPRSADAQA